MPGAATTRSAWIVDPSSRWATRSSVRVSTRRGSGVRPSCSANQSAYAMNVSTGIGSSSHPPVNASNVCTPAASRCHSRPDRSSIPSGMLRRQNRIGSPTTVTDSPCRRASAATARPYGPAPMTSSSMRRRILAAGGRLRNPCPRRRRADAHRALPRRAGQALRRRAGRRGREGRPRPCSRAGAGLRRARQRPPGRERAEPRPPCRARRRHRPPDPRHHRQRRLPREPLSGRAGRRHAARGRGRHHPRRRLRLDDRRAARRPRPHRRPARRRADDRRDGP